MMKIKNKMMLFIFVTLYAMSPGLTVCAEPDTAGENKPPTGLLGWTHLEGEKGFHLYNGTMVVKKKKKFERKQAHRIDVNKVKEDYFDIYETHHV